MRKLRQDRPGAACAASVLKKQHQTLLNEIAVLRAENRYLWQQLPPKRLTFTVSDQILADYPSGPSGGNLIELPRLQLVPYH